MKRKFTSIFLMLFCCCSIYVRAQQIKISGKVVTSDGIALPGVSIKIKGSNIGTQSSPEGQYNLTAPGKESILIFSYIGYVTREIEAAQVDKIMVLTESAVQMQDVVVTALGIKRQERALGYSVQKVSGGNLQKVSGVDLATSLTGKVAGLLVKNSSDFAAAPVLSIRGETPLLVIDGVAYANKTLSDMSSEDIESISVLKGATASALYGFRGANGAILVTTKNGSGNNSGLEINLTSNTMFSAGYLAIPEVQALYGRGGTNTYDKNSDEVWGGKMDGSIQSQWDPALKGYRDYAYLPVGKDNFRNFLEKGYITNNNFNIAYKEGKAALRSSLNWTQNKGRYPNSTLEKYTYAFGGDINLDKLKLSSNLSYTRRQSPNIGTTGYTSYDPMYTLLIWTGTDYNILDYKDNYWIKKGETQNFSYQANYNNPYFDRYEKTNEISRDIFNADISASYDLADWLKASVRSGLDFYTDRGDLRVSQGSYVQTGNTPIPGNLYTWIGAFTGGYATGRTSGMSMNNDLLLTGDRTVDKFKIEYLAGATIFYKKDNNINANTTGGISVPGFFSLKASVNPANIGTSTNTQQVNSLYGRIGLSWNSMAFIEATGRNDWSSTLAKDNRSYFYPSVAASFVVSELMPNTKNWLDLLKIRGSWTISKTPAAIYAINSDYSLATGVWGPSFNSASAPGSLYATNIRPQSAATFETGLMATGFKNRLTVDVSYYNKRMYDFLKYAPVSPATGYSSNYINIQEEISRRGWEIILNGAAVKTRDWGLDIGMNWSTYASYYTKLDPTYSDVKPWVKVGERSDPFISRDFVKAPDGNLIFSSNGRLQYSQYDSRFGYQDPNFVWGVNSTIRYKNFSLYFALDGVVGGLMNTRTESYMWQSGVHPNSVTDERAKDVATPGSRNFLGQGVKVVSGTATYDAFGNITSDTRVFAPNDVYTTYKQYVTDLHNSSAWGGNGSPADTYSKTFFKLRELSLSYAVPTRLLHGIAKAASISLIGQNMLLWAKDFKYSDPDGGGEDFSDPAVRYIGANLKLTF
uniref:SusC/RagA family TonB-linked outer membrane protein n=1 Tax=Pedobacter schmidteae TaxID=2201271 RepID=UPI000EB4B295|nr:SusC/RagA family TonB-linked outer membrane protein [Pedobacter schmidteae]